MFSKLKFLDKWLMLNKLIFNIEQGVEMANSHGVLTLE